MSMRYLIAVARQNAYQYQNTLPEIGPQQYDPTTTSVKMQKDLATIVTSIIVQRQF